MGVDILLALPLLALDGCRVQPFGMGVRDLDESTGAVTEVVCFCLRVDMIDVNASFVSSGTLDEWLRGAELLNYISKGKQSLRRTNLETDLRDADGRLDEEGWLPSSKSRSTWASANGLSVSFSSSSLSSESSCS